MAITKLLKIKESKQGSNKSAGLRACLKYIANPDKTEGLLLTGGSSGGDPDLTYSDMVANKRSWEKTSGTQGYHYILSLPPDEHPDAETMRALTEDFCTELLKEEHLYAYAIHVDRGHLHSHIVFDSVSCTDGKMWKSGKYDWIARIQPITDRLCAKYGLKTLSFDPNTRGERKNQYHAEWEESLNPLHTRKGVSWTDIIRSDVDQALSLSHTWEQFLSQLKHMRYDVKDGLHLSVKPREKDRFVRTGRLGPKYEKESLLKRLGEPAKDIRFGSEEELLHALRTFFEKTGTTELSDVKKSFYERWYAYSYVNKCDAPYRYRGDLVELGKYSDRCVWLFKHDITTAEGVSSYIKDAEEHLSDMERELRRVNNQLYNTSAADWRTLEKLRTQLSQASEVEQPVIQKQIDRTVSNLRGRDLIAESDQYHSLVEKKKKLQEKTRALKADLVLAKGCLQDLEKSRDPGDIMQDPTRYKVQEFTKESYRRITINQVLFADALEEADYLRYKIPGVVNEFVLVPKPDVKHCVGYDSIYVYDHLEYRVVDAENQIVRQLNGSDVLLFYKDRTRSVEKGR